MKMIILVKFIHRREFSPRAVHVSVLIATLYGISRVSPFSLHPFEISEPGTILIRVEHAYRNE
jgi:hypothetical protein